MSSTKISNFENFNISSLVFNDAIKSEVQAAPGKPAIRIFRVPIRVRNDDGSIGNLVFAPKNVFTFGVSENKDQNSDAVNGYTLPLTLYDKDGPTPQQTAFVETLKSVIEACKQHLIKDEIRKSIIKPTLKYEALEKLDKMLYFKLDEKTGLPVEGRGPSMYPKLYTRKGEDGMISITTEFFDSAGRTLDPYNLIGKYGHTNPAIVIDSIFIGAAMSIQVRVMEAEINLISSSGRRLLPRPRADETVKLETTFVDSAPTLQPAEQPTLTRQHGIVEEFPAYNSEPAAPVQGDLIVDEDEPVVQQPPVRTAPKKMPTKASGKR